MVTILKLIFAIAMGTTFANERLEISSGQAHWLVEAPPVLKTAVAAANRISGMPYKYAGGHGSFDDDGYDCSGAASYVLHAAGLLEEAMDSSQFMEYGEPGAGEWITVHARAGHVFLVIAGIRFDTTDAANVGPGWRELERAEGFVIRHPAGF